MKKICSVILCLLMTAGILSGCGNNNTANHDIAATNEKLSIVTTIFPEYDWVWEIMGDQADNAEITMLLDNGVDLHSYQPTADDIIKISTCDMFIYVGGESDEWVEDALKEDTNKNMVVINLLDVLGDSVKTEELVEGMQESEHEHDHGGEIDTADIQDRTLSEFAGDWQSIHPLLVNGDLDEYLEHLAEEDGDDTTTADTYRERYTGSWECDATSIAINGSTITFTFADGSTQSADYIFFTIFRMFHSYFFEVTFTFIIIFGLLGSLVIIKTRGDRQPEAWMSQHPAGHQNRRPARRDAAHSLLPADGAAV